MALRPTDGLRVAPWCCRRCGCALWWQTTAGVNITPDLVDARGRALCRPLMKYNFRPHELPQVERKPR